MPANNHENHDESKKMWREAAGLSYLGIFFGVAIVIGFLGGSFADRHLHTGHWLSVVGILFGIAASAKELYRVTRQYRRQNRAPDAGGPDDKNLA